MVQMFELQMFELQMFEFDDGSSEAYPVNISPVSHDTSSASHQCMRSALRSSLQSPNHRHFI